MRGAQGTTTRVAHSARLCCRVVPRSHAVSIRKHLERSRKDKDSKFRCGRGEREERPQLAGRSSTLGQRASARLMLLLLLMPMGAARRLILVESRIHRLARYYKRVKKLPPNW